MFKIDKKTKREIINLLKNKYFYIGIIILISGIVINLMSQTYLYNETSNGQSLPKLNDFILSKLPYYDVSFLYDLFSMLALVIFIIYTIHKKQYSRLPFILFCIGIFQILRGVFIILTPFVNHLGFEGAQSVFKGFSKYELGVFPSGHTEVSVMYAFLSKGIYRWILAIITFGIILSLLFSRGHYSIDILSGLLFAYAIYSFSSKYLKKHLKYNQKKK